MHKTYADYVYILLLRYLREYYVARYSPLRITDNIERILSIENIKKYINYGLK